MVNQARKRLGQITSNYKNSQQAPSLNNNQYSSYYSKLYPGLNEESYNKMVNAVDSLGLTGENRANAMNNYYRTHVKTLINDQTLQERDDIINQQAYEAAKLNNKDADAELRMTEAVQKAKKLWNLDATANDREVFSTMVETLGAAGTKIAGEYLSGENDELLYATGIKDTAEQEQAKEYNLKRQRIQNAMRWNWRELSDDGLKYIRDYNVIFDTINEARNRGIGEGMSDFELLKELMDYSPELKELGTELNKLQLSNDDKVILGESDSQWANDWNQKKNNYRELFGWNSQTPVTTEDILEEIYVREKGGTGEIGKNFKANLRNVGDSWEKFGYRSIRDIENAIYKNLPSKNILQLELGRKLTDEEYNQIIQERIASNKEEIRLYNESLDKEAQASRDKIGLDPIVQDYFNKHGITESLFNNNLEGAGYKMAGETAGNRDMLLGMGASIVNPAFGMMVMGTDTFARENQESFDSLINAQMKQGVSYEDAYDNATKGAAVVGLVNTAIELGLEKALGGVETTTAKNIKQMFTQNLNKEVTEMVAKKGIAELMAQGLTTQARASLEEGLEEILQQAVQNIAVSQYDPDKEISEGLWEAFESGALNPMNILAGGSDLYSNISENSDSIRESMENGAYNAGRFVGGIYNAFNSQSIVDNIQNSMLNGAERAGERAGSIYYGTKNLFNKGNQNVTTENIESENVGAESTAIAPQGTETTVDNSVIDMDNGAIELMDEETTTEDNANTDLAETQGGSKFWEAVSGLEDNIKEKIKRNPYAIEESRELIKNMENNPGLDFTEYQNERYESVLDMIEERLKQAEEKRKNDVGGLYTKLEEANAPIDTTNLKNRVAEYQARVEELGDILSSSDKAKIETILKNIQEIGDGTMDIWKVRKIADQWAKYDQGATGDGIRLIRDIRNAIDDEIMAQNPEMKEVDQAYKKAKDEIQDLRGNLTYKKTGEIKSNAVSTVKNMLNANNKKYLSTLEKYIPGITERLQAIRDSKLVYNAYTSGEGSRFVSKGRDFVTKGILAGGGYLLGGPVGAGVGYLISGKVDAAITSLARKGLKETITKETAESKAELERINKKIEENQRLEAEEKAKLKELGDRIMQKMATMDKTDAEQSAWNNWLADLEQDEVIDMPEEVYDQWEEVTTTPKKKTTKKKTSKKGLDKNQASSKTAVVDKNGNPKNVYHYSDTDFDTFDMSKQKNKLGIYFSPSSKPNSTLRKFKITATIDMKNPLTISPENKASMIYPELKEYLADEYEDQYDTKFRELLIKDGYDGVIMLDDKGNVSQYVVLNPEQVNVKRQGPIKKS